MGLSSIFLPSRASNRIPKVLLLTSVFIQLYFLEHFDFVRGEVDLSSRVVIEKEDEVTYQECESRTNQIDQADIYFDAAFGSSSTVTGVQSLMISGWIYPKGYKDKSYMIFSIRNSSPSGLLYEFVYHPVAGNLKFEHTFKYGIVNCVVSNVQNSWFYYQNKITIQATTIPQLMDRLEFILLSNESITSCASPLEVYSNSNPAISSIEKSKAYFNFGQYSFQQVSSCAIVRNMVLYFGDQPMSDLVLPHFHRKSAMFANLRNHYDFFYSKKNSHNLLSFTSPPFQRLENISITENANGEIEIVSTAQLCLDPIFEMKYQGYILYFEFQATSNFPTIFELKSQSTGNSLLKLYISSTNQLIYELNSVMKATIATLDSSTLHKWHSAAVIVSWFLKKEVILMVNFDDNLQTFVDNFPLYEKSSLPCFGNTSTSTIINNIRIYDGAMVAESDTCHVYTVGSKKNECLFCKSPNILSYQEGATCIDPGTSKITYTLSRLPLRVADWDRSECDSGMMHMKYTADCFCQYSQYVIGSSCSDCPRYCKGCSTGNTCDFKDSNRTGSNGECHVDYFDDGYNCIPRLFSISKRSNMFEYLSNGVSYSWVLDSSYFSVSTPFLIIGSFTKINYNAGVFLNCLFTFKNNGIEIITVFLQRSTSSSNLMRLWFQANIGSGLSSNDFFLNSESSAQFGIWLSSNKITFFVQNNGQFTYRSITPTGSSLSIVNPSLCIGKCTSSRIISGATQSPFPGTDTDNFMRFYKDIADPENSIEDAYNLASNFPVFYADFTFQLDPITHLQPSQLGVFSAISNKNTLLLDISSTKTKTHLYKGVAWMNDSATPFINVDNKIELSFSLNIFIEQLSTKYTFLTYTLDTLVQGMFSLIPNTAISQSTLEVCFDAQCVQMRQCPIYNNEPNFVGSKLHVKIETVCNYRRETYRFPDSINMNTDKLTSIQIMKSLPTEEVYLNNIRFMSGSDFYFDYTKSEWCFLYFNTISMICLKAKPGYLLLNYKLIKEADCTSQLQSPNQTVVVANPYTQECFDTNVYMPSCKTLDPINTTLCFECFDPNADPLLNCACYDGYFFSTATSFCEACSSQCLSCIDSAINCIECAIQNANPAPSCLCADINQFIQADSSCAYCMSKCETCTSTDSNCLTCAEGRLNPPFCTCNPAFFNTSTSTDTSCIPYTCDSKCATCSESSSNCTTCATNRVNAPACECADGFYEINTSTPATCECPLNQFEVSGVCTSCPAGKYYNINESTCKSCNANCVECENSASECTVCPAETFLINKQCFCEQRTSTLAMISASTGKVVCTTYMDTSLSLTYQDQTYYLTFTFESIIDELEISSDQIDSIFYLYLKNIPQSAYEISSVHVLESQVVLTLTFKESFKAQGGYVQFQVSSIFASSVDSKVLDPLVTEQLFEFEIGPLIISDAVQEATTEYSAVSSTIRQGGNFLYIVQQFQICLYVLNTLQPSSIFLLVNAVVPSNFYSFLQITGLFVFPNVTDYGTFDEVNSINVFGWYTFEKNVDYLANSSFVFRQLGFSSAVILSIPLTVIFYFLWSILYFVFTLKLKLTLNKSREEAEIQKLAASNAKKKEFLWARIVSGNEAGALLLTVSVINQFKNTDENFYMNRQSVYACTLIAIGQLYSIYWSYRMLFCEKQDNDFSTRNNDTHSTNSKFSMLQYTKFVNQKQNSLLQPTISDQSNRINPVLEKLDLSGEKNPILIKRYFFSQILKKYFLAIALVIFDDVPQISCLFAAFIMGLSLLGSIYLRPYKHLVSNFAKIIGEACNLLVWLIYLTVFIPMNELFDQTDTISDENMLKFTRFGIIAIVALFVLNVVYFIEFLTIQIVFRILEFLKKKKAQSTD